MTSQSDGKESNNTEYVYYDRNLAVMALARLAQQQGYTVGIALDLAETPEWQTVIMIDLPTGQVGWHIRESELQDDWPAYPGKWDGHSDELKWDRIKAFLAAQARENSRAADNFSNTLK